jgi:glycosyltransferase involved in cell wall biosynthesis
MNPTISIIIPFLNEEDNIGSLVNELENYFQSNKELTAEVIFINDGSTDNSLHILKQLRINYFKAKIISLSKNYGSHAALRAGIFHASGKYIGFMYADLQDPLYLINEMYHELIKGFDICWATRKSTKNGLFEKTFSKFYSSMMKKYAMPNYPDNGFDIVMFNKKVQDNLNHNIEANSSVFLQILNLGYKQNTISYNKQVRKNGKSKWTISKKIKLFIDSFVAFSFAPIRLVTIIGFILFVIGLICSSYVIIRKVFYDDLISGWPTLISILLIGFGITNISLGIIAEYLWRTMDYSRNRPVFIIDEIIELKNE